MDKAGAGLPRSFTRVVGELHHQANGPQAAAFSCSSDSTGYGKALRGAGFLGHLELMSRLALLSIRPPQSRACRRPSCSMQGIWEDADSEDKANRQFTSRKCTLEEEFSLLLSLAREIPPLDINLISKEASSDSIDAMKRTISGMLGLLPSDQFSVTVKTMREPLAKLFVSSVMTGYTLRNAEYRLCLKRSLEVSGDEAGVVSGDRESAGSKEEQDYDENYSKVIKAEADGDAVVTGMLPQSCTMEQLPTINVEDVESLDPIDDKVKDYIQSLKHRLASVSEELEECKRINMGLHMQNIVGEEKNDLLDYLRSLEPDKVAELSQPTSSEVESVIQQVINDLLDSPSTKLQYKGAQWGDGQNVAMNASGFGHQGMEDGAQKCSASPLQFQSIVIVNRDYLARLLFWCMLMGHHMRGMEYRLELSRTLSLIGDIES